MGTRSESGGQSEQKCSELPNPTVHYKVQVLPEPRGYCHKLKLNDDKTVIMEIRTPCSMSALSDLHIMVGHKRITLPEATRNLGVFLPAL